MYSPKSIIKKLLTGITVVCSIVAIGLSSCQQQEETIEPIAQQDVINHSAAKVEATTTYTTSPATNAYTNCGGVVVSSGSCGTFVSGYIRAKVISNNGSQFVVRIERCNNQQLFGGVGMAYINATNFCGTQAGKAQILSNYWYVDVTINATFTTGSVDFVPMVILPGQNIKWIGQHIKITATPILSPTFPITTMKNSSLSSSGNTYCVAPTNVFAPANIGQCTWYVYGRVQELVANGYVSSNSGNILRNAFLGKSGRDARAWSSFIGGTWSSQTPLDISKRKKGMIVVWDNVYYKGVKTGHVGFVEEISADKTKFRVSEFNVTPLKYTSPEKWFSFDNPRNVDGSNSCYPSFYMLDVLK
jgi:surface antigen